AERSDARRVGPPGVHAAVRVLHRVCVRSVQVGHLEQHLGRAVRRVRAVLIGVEEQVGDLGLPDAAGREVELQAARLAQPGAGTAARTRWAVLPRGAAHARIVATPARALLDAGGAPAGEQVAASAVVDAGRTDATALAQAHGVVGAIGVAVACRL